MNRFRTDRKWKDRWGGGFIVLAVLMVIGAYLIGDYYSNQISNNSDGAATLTTGESYGDAALGGAGGMGTDGLNGTAGATGAGVQPELVGFPRPLTVYFVQAGAFTSGEKAAQQVDALGQSGFPAAVTQSGPWHKVYIGAYRSREAALAARGRAESISGLPLYTAPVDLASAPTALPASTNAGMATAYRDALAALSGYLHESANFWDAQALGQPVTHQSEAYARTLGSLADQLRTQAGDPAVSRLLTVADKVKAASLQQSGLAAATNANSEQVQAAMQGYLNVLSEYRDWTEGEAGLS